MADSSLTALMADPAFAAFIAAAGLQDEVALADVARRKDAITQSLGLSTEDIERSGEQERRGIAGGYESRGLFRSGTHLQAQGEQEERQARNLAVQQLGAATQSGDLDANLVGSQAQRQFDITSRGLDAASGLTAQAGEDETRRMLREFATSQDSATTGPSPLYSGITALQPLAPIAESTRPTTTSSRPKTRTRYGSSKTLEY